tara:strand:- start:428 stop:1063 length:636 start_codon:yes stop_codon:yes gene_type:complete
MDFLISLGKGLLLGGSICVLGMFLDKTICANSLKKIDQKLYDKGIYAVRKNMLVVGPLTYAVVDHIFVSPGHVIQWFNVISILMIHSVGYYGVHYGMHKLSFLQPIHEFHHRFEKTLVPSIGNAVSMEEFILAYMAPFIFGAYLLRPNEISFIIPIKIIALLNLLIHCQEAERLSFVKWWVSPKNHIDHHRYRYKHYAAPTINWDYFIENS